MKTEYPPSERILLGRSTPRPSREGSVPTGEDVAVRVRNRKRYGVWPNKKERRDPMKRSEFKSYDELPLFLNAELVAQVLGIAPSSAYELMHEPEFPTLRIGNRMVVPKEKFIQWVEGHTKGGEV